MIKRGRLARVLRFLFGAIKVFSMAFTAVALIITQTPVANWLAAPLSGVAPDMKKADIIAVLGGGAYKEGVLSPASTDRLLHGLLLYREGYAERIIFSGGSITGMGRKLRHTVLGTDASGSIGVVEASLMMRTAAALGVPEGAASVDAASTNTRENIVNIKGHMERNGLKTCLMVTSSTHMLRSHLVARKSGLACSPAPVPDYSYLRMSAIDRLGLFRAAAWEYSAIALYWLYGYI
jgi:uncharacterized SAM-binding protein YcdF (DUF218 family)